MRILQINTERGWRGGERQTLYLLQGLRNAGVDVALLCRAGQPLAQHASAQGIPIHAVQGNRGAFWFLLRHAQKFDILHPQTAKSHTHAILSKPAHQKPVVYTRRAGFVPKGILTRLKYRASDHVVAISEFIKQVVEQSLGIANVSVIPSAVMPQSLDIARARGFLQTHNIEGKKIVATTAALTREKDPQTLVRAIAHLKTLRDDFVFLHFGAGELQDEIEALIKQLDVESCYRLVGFVERVEDFYSIFDVFAISSREEGLGSSVLDAFQYNVPVVATSAGGLRELVDTRGVLCAPGDSKAIADGVNLALSDSAWRATMTARALAYVQQNYSRNAIIEKYLTLYNTLLDKRH